jgi:hypothetical protein
MQNNTSRGLDWKVYLTAKGAEGIQRFVCVTHAPDMETAKIFVTANALTYGLTVMNIKVFPFANINLF